MYMIIKLMTYSVGYSSLAHKLLIFLFKETQVNVLIIFRCML